MKKIYEPFPPSEKGYVFCGWYEDENFENAFDFNKSIDKNYTLYAKWKSLINNIAVTGVVLPVQDETISVDTIQLDSDATYEFAELNPKVWYSDSSEDGDFTVNCTGKSYVGGSYYQVWIRIVPKEGYSFEDVSEMTATINGEIATLHDYSKRYGYYVIEKKYYCEIHTHTEEEVIVKATTQKNGSIEYLCSDCGKKIKDDEIIYRPATYKLSQTSFVGNGTVQKPTVTVYDVKNKKIDSSNYTLKYSNESSKNPGTYKITITFVGDKYSGSKLVNYTITEPAPIKTGWIQEESNMYYYDQDGNYVTGWNSIDGKWYYFESSGVMVKSWKKINEKWYYFETSGVMVTGWKKISEKWYYFDTSGVMQASKWISGVYYVKSDRSMAASEWVDNGKYYIGSDGKWIKDYQEIN